MTTAVQRRRGTNTEHASFTGLEGEISVNTTNESVHVHDGSTAGGFELMRADGANSTVSLGDITGVTAGTGLSGGGTTGTVTLDIDGTVATLAGTQTFTNKTLTSPILNTPTIGTSFTIGGATITEAELEILDGATVTTTELNYVDGVTSSIQTQIDAKAPLASPSFTGNISVTGTVDGRDVAGDGTKLDGIEASADVTDTANVTAAGALMDSELTSIASVKALNQGVATTDSPTFDDGTFTGILNITPTSGYGHLEVGGVDGAFIDLKSPSSDDYDLRMITTGGNGGTIDVGSTGDLSFNAGGSERARLLATGQVGIGTTSPGAPLHVQKGSAGSSAFPSGDWAAKIFNQTDASTEHGLVVANRWQNDSSTAFEVGGLYDDGNGFDTWMKVTGGGKVGIGTSSPAVQLHVENSASTSEVLRLGSSTVTHDTGIYMRSTGTSKISWGSGGNLAFYGGGAGTTERMRIDSSGNVLVGTTTAPTALATSTNSSDTGMSVGNNGRVTFASNNTYSMTLNRYSSNGVILRFSKDGVLTGTISTNGSNLPSDRNFKKNISDLALGLDFVNSLSPKTYNFKIDDEGQPVMTGLIAQEVEAALTAAGVERNSMTLLQHEPTENVNDSDYQMDYVKFVPILINSIKEQQTLIDSLTARIVALEA